MSAFFRFLRPIASVLPALILLPLCGCHAGTKDVSKDSLSSFSQSTSLQGSQNLASSLSAQNPASQADNTNVLDAKEKVDQIRLTPAEGAVDTTGLDLEQVRSLFQSLPVDEDMLSSYEEAVYSPNQTFITPAELRLVRLLYFGFDGRSHAGELLVNEKIAQDVEEIFFELYKNAYPIERISIPNGYGQDDNAIMSDDITRALAFTMDDNGQWQEHEHSLGLAIDMNQLYNPQVIVEGGQTTILPPAAEPYADRSVIQPHMMDENDLAVQLFTEHGFTWGGIWEGRNDYQHFEKGFDHDTGHMDPNLHYGN